MFWYRIFFARNENKFVVIKKWDVTYFYYS